MGWPCVVYFISWHHVSAAARACAEARHFVAGVARGGDQVTAGHFGATGGREVGPIAPVVGGCPHTRFQDAVPTGAALPWPHDFPHVCVLVSLVAVEDVLLFACPVPRLLAESCRPRPRQRHSCDHTGVPPTPSGRTATTMPSLLTRTAGTTAAGWSSKSGTFDAHSPLPSPTPTSSMCVNVQSRAVPAASTAWAGCVW